MFPDDATVLLQIVAILGGSLAISHVLVARGAARPPANGRSAAGRRRSCPPHTWEGPLSTEATNKLAVGIYRCARCGDLERRAEGVA